jgi:hypothetical protein
VGQNIEMSERTVVGDVVILTLNRNLTSMATRAFTESPSEVAADDFVALLAKRVFDADSNVTRVYAAANAVQVTRTGGWDADTDGAVDAIVADLYRFYD